jgi:hypothetical protein
MANSSRLDPTPADQRYFVTAAVFWIGAARVPRSNHELSPSPQELPLEDESATIPIRRAAPQKPAGDVRLSPRGLLLGAIVAMLALVAILLGLRFFFADNTPDMTEATLQTAMQQWQARGPASYDLDVRIGGAQPGVAHVEVRNGVVQVATRDGRPLQDWNKDEWSIPGQFEALEREFEFKADPQGEMDAPPGATLWLRCEFDPKYGYPRRFHRYATGGAPEVYWRNTLQPR